MGKKKAVSKQKKSKVASKTTKKSKAKKKIVKKAATKSSTSKQKSAAKVVELKESLALQGDHAHTHKGFQDDKQTSLKRRRTSGQTYTGAVREEKRRVTSMEVEANKDERVRIRAPRRSRNQIRSR